MTTIKEIKKGCGRMFEHISLGVYECGENRVLCPTCEAKLQTKKEDLEIIRELNIRFRKDNIPQKLSGDEFNDLWEEELTKLIEGKQEDGE